MGEKLCNIIDESIKLEQNASKLYQIFSAILPQDSGFWTQLSREEDNHAILIETGRTLLCSIEEFPEELLCSSLEDLIEENAKLKSLIAQYTQNKPSREEAFNTALALESCANEAHFQMIMEKSTLHDKIELFQKLNEDDIEHAKRINEYMDSNDIKKLNIH